MYYSFFEIFSIGVGPSSSHTVGPMRAAKRFLDNLQAKSLFDKVAKVDVTLYGSLALTGEGHGTVKAIVYGLMGLDAEVLDPSVPYIEAVEKNNKLSLGQKTSIDFSLKDNIFFKKDVFLPEHSNSMKFEAFDEDNNSLLGEVYFSVGGGTIARHDEIARRIEREPYDVPYDYSSCAELTAICTRENLTMMEVVLANEYAIHGKKETLKRIAKVHKVMNDSIDKGIIETGILPGSLKMKRRANAIFQRLESGFKNNDNDPLVVIDWINLWGFAVAEENAAGGKIVTAPTMGSSGVIPAVLRYYERFASAKSPLVLKKGLLAFFTTASAICSLYRCNASISGAEVGCQGEVGVACSMAAAGLVAAMGGNTKQIENAAEIAMEHNLGLTCDPIAGLVQVPCIERNAMGAVKAVNSARIAMKGSGEYLVSLDSVIKTMYDTGIDMHNKYKETSLGGLAINVACC